MNQLIQFLHLNNQNNKINYIYLIFLLFSLFLTLSIFYDILQIHMYRHDALYYMQDAEVYYRMKIPGEGRWVNYLLFDLLTHIPGSILSIFSLLSFGYFIFTVTYRWAKNYYYALIVALLFMQIPSFYDLITWPASIASGFFVLLFSVFLQKRLNIFVYFILFGVLFFGTMSNYYYLLPLLYLGYLKNHGWKENVHFVSFKLIPAWAIGFVIGYIVTQLIVYINVDHLMTISKWRKPHYVHSIGDLLDNIVRSYHYLEKHMTYIFLNGWIIALYVVSFMVAVAGRRKDLIFIPFVLFFLIIVIHYIIVLPIGIMIQARTIVATWVGVLAIVFLIPSIKNWQIYLLVPLIVFFTSRLYLDNHHNMQWYRTIKNMHLNKLLMESPKPPSEYKGVILYASRADVKVRNRLIAKIKHTPVGNNIEGQGTFRRWTTSAWKAGFKTAGNCDGSLGKKALFHSVKDIEIICHEISSLLLKEKTIAKDNINFFNILGEYQGLLIISFNENWDQK